MKCKLLKIKNDDGLPRVLLGTIISSDEYFITLKTRNHTHILNKSTVLCIIDSEEEFEDKAKEKISFVNGESNGNT